MGRGGHPLRAPDRFLAAGTVNANQAKASSWVTPADNPTLSAQQGAIFLALPGFSLSIPNIADCSTEQPRGFIARQPAVSTFRLGRQGNLRNHAKRVFRVVRVDGSPQIFKPAPRGLVGHLAFAGLDPGSSVAFVRRAGGPIDEIATELRLDRADCLVAKEVVEIEKTDQEQVVLRPRSLVILVLGAFGSLVSGQDVGYGEDTRVSRSDCTGVSSTNVGFERLRSAVNIVAAAACADLPAPIEDDPGVVVLSEPESWRLGFAAWHDGLTNLRIARGVVRFLPATLAISRVPTAAALRNDDNVKGPCGKNTTAASTRVITSSSPHWAGSGRAFARANLSVVRMSWARFSSIREIFGSPFC